MKLNHDLHLAYCTNIHRAESWPETLAALQEFTLAVRKNVCPGQPYAIGLRLSDLASRELSRPEALLEFHRWLDRNNCYVFTINGFPYGQFHGRRVKEQVYCPDWTSDDRVNYTNRLFDLLGQLVPPGIEGSVSTVPGLFKEFVTGKDKLRRIHENIFRCVEHIARVGAQTGRRLHLGLEPEPLCLLETTEEAVRFFDELHKRYPNDSRLDEFLGVNYDTCHLALEFENPAESLARLREHGIKISKLHLSSALKLRPTAASLAALAAFADDTWLHQVVSRAADGKLTRYRDLEAALAAPKSPEEEWRVHFHIPLHSPPADWFENTTDHLLGVLDVLQANPRLCSHLEMETYTWEVLPPELKNRTVVGQLSLEYEWCLNALKGRGLA
ncbi:MAG: metabolite traffic protein EboE [Limisphaerales bacterium]